MAELSTRFPDELDILRRVFGADAVAAALPRLQVIFGHTEALWWDYVQTLHGEIRYVLIAEAPPWVAEGVPQYLLDPASKSRTLMRALARVFPRTEASPLETFAARGFLLFDSIPFAMDYRAKRGSRAYTDLVAATVESYLVPKLTMSTLRWGSDVRVAFAVARNARAIRRATPSLKVGSKRTPLSEDLIAVNAAGYPDITRLRHVFGLKADDA